MTREEKENRLDRLNLRIKRLRGWLDYSIENEYTKESIRLLLRIGSFKVEFLSLMSSPTDDMAIRGIYSGGIKI